MPKANTRFAVVIGTNLPGQNTFDSIGPTQTGRVTYEYFVSYMGAAVVATNQTYYKLKKGDYVIVDRRAPSLNLAIVARVYGDSDNGTPYDGTGGIMNPTDVPGAGSATGTVPFPIAGYFRVDLGPGFNHGILHP